MSNEVATILEIAGVVGAIIFFIVSLKSFWINRIIAFLLCVARIVLFIIYFDEI